jgi:ferredoxin
MAGNMFLNNDRIAAWLEELSAEATVYAPVRAGEAVEFLPYSSEAEIELREQPTAPPKKVVFPQTETLLRYRYEKDPENPDRQIIQLKETLPEEKSIVFGCRPCGARGFAIFDPVYDSDQVTDPYYTARREQTLFISLACREPENACFCHWVGGNPADPTGSDLLLVPVTDGYLVEAHSDQGRGLLAAQSLDQASESQVSEAGEVKARALEALDEPPDLSDVPARLLALFDDLGFWEDVSAKCISCGACTYLCPTCYCFNISDEAAGLTGKRIRTWDNCMSFLFTLEGSGHNPRSTKAHRLRNRVGHKFSYYPELHEGVMACCGCGRCIKSCPVAVDIREIVLRAKEAAHE